MKILFTVPAGNFTPALPLGVLSIASYLKDNGHTVRICDRMFEQKNFRNILREFSPDAVAVSVMSNVSLKDAEDISEICHKNNIPVIWGGQLSTGYASVILEAGKADYISLGEGEKNLLRFADSFDKNNGIPDNDIPGIALKENGKVTINPFESVLCGDELPKLDFSLIDVKRYFQSFFGTKKMVHLYISKGCPFNCTFCNTKAFGDKKYRRRKLEDVIDEITYLVKVCKADGIYFYDELFSLNKEDAFEFCDAVSKTGLDFSWGCFARIGQYTKEDLRYFYDCGCRWILFGIESGSEEMRKKIKKQIRTEDIRPTFEACREAGITTQATFIVGFPGETPEQLKETADCIFEIGADLYPVSNFTLIPGSENYYELLEQNKVKPVTTYEEIGYSIMPVEKIVNNYSQIPLNELKAVRGFFRWCGFSDKNSVNSQYPFEAAKDIAGRYIKIVFRNKKLNFDGIADALNVLNGVMSFVFHPAIRKKYGLYKKRFRH